MHVSRMIIIVTLKCAFGNAIEEIILRFLFLKGFTSLQIAAMYDYTDVISALMESKADPNIFREVGQTNYCE